MFFRMIGKWMIFTTGVLLLAFEVHALGKLIHWKLLPTKKNSNIFG